MTTKQSEPSGEPHSTRKLAQGFGAEASAPQRTPGFDPDALENAVLTYWDKEQTFAKSLENRKDAKRYSFYDGPPYATGIPHYGHILQTTLKDTVTRYWTMRGFRVDRRVGWDCHGLPVENLIEKELGIKNKRQIEEMGIEKFNAACRASVFRSVDEFQRILRRMGRWADYSNAYATLDWTYMESIWWVWKQLWDAGFVTHGVRSSPYCPRCATPLSNFETAQGYKEVEDPAITVKLRVTDRESTYLLIWTTTPWTLPGNVAIAVHPDLRYVQVKVADEHWILAKDRLSDVVDTDYTLEEEYAGAQLVGWTYEPLYTFLTPDKPAYRVVAGSFVSATDGTGIVHLAPAFGEDDLATAQAEDLPILKTVDDNGRMVAAVTSWAGMFVKEADPLVIKDLEDQGLLLRNDKILHQYPFCWRCDTPLIYYATDSWFVGVSRIHEQLLANNEQIQWVPEHLKHGRFGQGLNDAPDWAISRRRYWGTPIPVWTCEACGENTTVGSVDELQKLGADLSPIARGEGKEQYDLHRPYVDSVTFPCPKCKAPTKRVPEVFDVWMDSGSMPYAQWHYPFENKEYMESVFPADFVGESLEMTRGWFYVLHVLATILTLKDRGLGVHKPAFLHVIASGFILAEDGRKLSKKYKNYTPVDDVVKRFGADTMRLYILASTSIGEDYRISDRLLEGLYRRFTLPLWNVLSFYETYAQLAGRTPGASVPPTEKRSFLDRWMLARVDALGQAVKTSMDDYHPDNASRELIAFVEDLSNWYVRRSRKRFASEDVDDRDAAFATLEEVLSQFALISAPFVPFLAEHMYRRMKNRSPHLEDFPADGSADAPILKEMSAVRAVVSAGLQARAEKGIKVRQPLASLATTAKLSSDAQELIRDEVNVKEVVAGKTPSGDGWHVVELQDVVTGLLLTLTPELEQEGMIRDLIRHVQELRKKSGLTVQDTIELAITTNDENLRSAVEHHRDRLVKETRAGNLVSELPDAEAVENVGIGDKEAQIRIRKMKA